MKNKMKARTIAEDKWQRKRCSQKCDNDAIKDAIKIGIILTLNAYNVKNQKTPQSMCKKNKVRKTKEKKI